MSAGLSPAINDRRYDLIFKAATNFYDYAYNFGVTGLNPPSLNDTEFVLWKKIAYYLASFVDTHP